MGKRVRLFALVWVGLTGTFPARAALFIDPGLSTNQIFDSTIRNDPNAASIEAAINQAIENLQNLFTNNVDVYIYFQEGSTLGENDGAYFAESYAAFYDALIAGNANPAAIAALQENGGNAATSGGINPVTNDPTILLKTAHARAMGINHVPACFIQPTGAGTANGNVPNQCGGSSGMAYDAILSVNTSITFPPQANNGSNYSLAAAVEHEMDEILGLGSSLANFTCNSLCLVGNYNKNLGGPFPEDLFRWNGNSRTLSTNCQSPTPANFSYGPGTGVIAPFNNACNGGDFGDWSEGSTSLVQDAFAIPGTNPSLSMPEIDALTAIGYIETTAPSSSATFSEIGVFRPSTPLGAALGVFMLDKNSADYNYPDTAVQADTQSYFFGLAGDIPVAGDWTGSGVIRIGVFRCPAAGVCNWYIDLNNNGRWDGVAGGDAIYTFGLPGDIPVVGDWNGGGISEIGVMRCPAMDSSAACTWYLDVANQHTYIVGSTAAYSYGLPGDLPAVGEWVSGSPVDHIGVFRCPVAGVCTWYVDSAGTGSYASGDATFTYGLAGDRPVVGNWYASGSPTQKRIGVFRPSTGQWILNTTGSGTFSAGDSISSFGLPGDLPVVGSWTMP